MELATICDSCTPLEWAGISLGIVVGIVLLSILLSFPIASLTMRHRVRKDVHDARRLTDQMNKRS